MKRLQIKGNNLNFRTQSKLQILTPISKRNINVAASNNSLVIFNRYSELKVHKIEKINPIRDLDLSVGFVPKLEITPRYVSDAPRHLEQPVSIINTSF
jgi:hypothetical protein